jgi:hypothetical protein
MATTHLNQPVVGIASTKDGRGYWLAAADGGIFTFGNAHYFGSLAGRRLDQPIVGISATVSGNGYRLVARDGGVFTFGDARYHGSIGGRGLTDVLGFTPTTSGNGYWILRKFGDTYCNGVTTCVAGPSVDNFGDARDWPRPSFSSDYDFNGNPAVAIVANSTSHGYIILRANGTHEGYAGGPGRI